MTEILKDRFTRGVIAGFLAGLVTLTWNLISRFVLHFATLNYWDFAAALVFHRAINAIWEGIFAAVIVKLFFAFLGIMFSFLIKTINSRLIILKGIFYGVGIWFAIYSFMMMFRIPGLTEILPRNPVSNFLGAAIYGLFLGYFIDLLNKRSEADEKL